MGLAGVYATKALMFLTWASHCAMAGARRTVDETILITGSCLSPCTHFSPFRINSEAFSPMAIAAALILEAGIVGMTDESTTRKP